MLYVNKIKQARLTVLVVSFAYTLPGLYAHDLGHTGGYFDVQKLKWTDSSLPNPLPPSPLPEDSSAGKVNSSNPLPPSPLPDKGSKKKKKCSGVFPITDWLNNINVGNFFDSATKYICRNNRCFTVFNSFSNVTFWLEPYGFYSYYNSLLNRNKVDLKMTSIGGGLGTRFSVSNQLYVSGGAGYFFSNFRCSQSKNRSNGLYFGPGIQYLFSNGSLGLTVFGMGNFYKDRRSCDVDVRLEGDYFVDTAEDFFIPELSFRPNVRIDYTHVFRGGSSFLFSQLAIRFEKIVLCTGSSFLTSNFDLGWANMSPLSHKKVEAKNQLLLGYELVGMAQSGWLIGVGYQATLGGSSPLQTGRVRIEWNW